MSRPGWYPDPGGAPGRFRFWDGSRWSAVTTDDPGSARGSPPGPAPRRRSPTMAAVATIVLVGLIVIFAIVAIRSGGRSAGLADPNPRPDSSVSAWDDSSPTPTPRVSATASPTPIGSPAQARCPTGLAQDEPPPDDGRVHGGPLSFTRLSPPWTAPSATARFPYSQESAVQTYRLPEVLPWQASVQVGVLAMPDFPGIDAAPDRLLRCVIGGDFYAGLDVELVEHRSRSVTVATLPASQLDARLAFRHPQLETTGSNLRIIVVDTQPVSYYFHAVPSERLDLINQLDATTASLRTV